MTDRKNQLKMTKIRHSSLDLVDPELKKKHQDVLSRARSKLLTLSDALKHRKADERQIPKSMTQCTFDYFFKPSQNKDNRDIYQNAGSKNTLQKQSSVGSYPIEIRVSSCDNDLDDDQEVFLPISRLRPATVCVDSPSVDRRSDAEALALERPRKKLSFREPEVDTRRQKSYSVNSKVRNGNISELSKQPNRTILNNHSGGDSVKNKIVNGKYFDNKPQSKFTFINHKSSDKTLKGHKSDSAANNINSNKSDSNFTLKKGIQSLGGIGLSVVNNGVHRAPSFENAELESQALRVVRTVGQAFEVCHKLHIGAPEDNLDDEQDTTLTQDFLSDRFSDVASDKPKKDITSEGANSDKNSLPPDDSSLKDSYLDNSIKRSKPPAHLDILPPPPSNSSSSRKSPLQAETYSAPHSDALGSSTNTGSVTNSLPPPGGALSSHHEIQLLKEQLEQQRQQTQAAVAQLQLAREQLQAEQTARMEAQARTHQLLVHNRELLDHIAALVAHLQGGDKPGQQSSPPHMTMPQQQRTQEAQADQVPQLDPNLVLQALGFSPPGIVENRAATTCQSPLRSQFSPSGTIFNYTFPPSPLQLDGSFETQLLQRLQTLGIYPSVSPQQYGWPLLPQGLYNPAALNNSYPVQNPNQYNLGSTPYATIPRSFANLENRPNTSRHSEPRQTSSLYSQNYTGQNAGQESKQQRTVDEHISQNQYQQYNHVQGYGQSISRDQYEKPNFSGSASQNQYEKPNFPSSSSQSQYEKPRYPSSSSQNQYEKTNFSRPPSQNHYEKSSFPNSFSQNKSGPQLIVPSLQRRHSSINLNQLQQLENIHSSSSNQRLEPTTETRQHRGVSPCPQSILSSHLKEPRETKFIKPLSQTGISNQTDPESRVRVILPDSNEEEQDLLTNLRSNDLRLVNGPGISRSASERLPNRSDLMSQVQRTMWARHTTK